MFGTLDNGEWSTYSEIDLRDLREGDCVGLLLSEDGVLEFTVNGKSQGIAAENIYTRNRFRDIYAYVGHWNAVATKITKAGKMTCLNTIQTVHSMTITHTHTHTHTHTVTKDMSLQVQCLENLSSWLKSRDEVDSLPIPTRLKDRLKELISDNPLLGLLQLF